MLRTLLFNWLILISGSLGAQLTLEEVDLSRIPPKKVAGLILEIQESDSLRYMSDLRSLCCENPEDYFFHEEVIRVPIEPDSLWQTYKRTNPGEAWNGQIVGFGLLYSGREDCLIYAGESFEGMEEGQMIFVNLRILFGVLEVPTVLEVTRVNDQQRILEFCYLNCSKSEGTQRVHLQPDPRGGTRIVHTTWYRSDSRFRDRNFYPYFHARAIREFHRNVKKAYRKHRVRRP